MASLAANDIRLPETKAQRIGFGTDAALAIAIAHFRSAFAFARARPTLVIPAAIFVTLLVVLVGRLLSDSADQTSELALVAPNDRTAAELVERTSVGANQLITIGSRAKAINASLPFSKAPIEPAAAFDLSTDTLEYSPALLCLASAVYHEAGFEPLLGRRAVAQVVLNRVRHPAFPKSICGVVFQGAGSPVCQFSFACDGSRARALAAGPWRDAMNIAAAALAGHVEPSVGTATHYHADYVAPRWAPLLPKITQIATHIFYRWPGDWGRPQAFRGRYGGEHGAPLRYVAVSAVELAAIEAFKTGKVRAMGFLEINDGKVSTLVVDGAGKGTKASLGAADVPFARSNAKPITVTLIARLVERELLAWNTPLEHLLPDLAATMRPEYKEVTLTELLSHRSGLPDPTDSEFFRSFHKDDRALPDQRTAYLQRALAEAPEGKRGSYSYSDTGFLAAAAAAERVTGQSFEELVTQEIFRPLKMDSVQLGEAKEGQPPRFKGRKLFSESEAKDPAMWVPAMGVPMSLADFGRFLLDQMHGERGKGKLLKAETYKFIHMPVSGATEVDGAGIGWSYRKESFGRHLFHVAADGSVGTAITMAPGNLDAIVVTADTRGKNGEHVISRAMDSVRASWIRAKRLR